MAFDPYRKWLGIPVRDQPPNHYRLLNIEALEADPDVISNAADARMAHIKQYQSGKHSDASQKILNEVAAAKICLLDLEKKAAYDEELREQLKPKKKPSAPPKAAPQAIPLADEPEEVLGGPAIPNFESPSSGSHVSSRSRRKKKGQPVIIIAAVAGVVLLLIGLAVSQFAWTGQDVANRPVPPKPTPGGVARPADAHKTDDGSATGGSRDPSDHGASDSRTPGPGADGLGTTDPDEPKPDAKRPGEGATDDPGESSGTDPSEPSFEELMGTGEREEPATGPDAPAGGDGPLTPDRLAVPDREAQQKVQREIREIFSDDFSAAAGNPRQKVVLARKLYDQAAETTDDLDVRFVLLRSACDLAAKAGDVSGAMQVVDEMQRDYEIKPLTVRVHVLKEAIESMAAGKRGEMAAQQIIMASMMLADEHVRKDDHDTASGFAGLALEAAKKSRNPDLIESVSARHREINRMKIRFASIKKAQNALSANPEDPAANLTAGRWYCFARGDWDKGLPLLAKGTDIELAEIAEQELSGPADTSAQVAMGDAWWKQADKEEDAIKAAVQARAKHWYQKALPSLDGLAKVKVAKRLEAIAATAAVTPATPGGETKPRRPKVRGAVQRGNVALATNGTVVTGDIRGASQLLDGNTTKYTISSGYAYSRWPCEWTITFDKVYNLNAIAIKLWDGDPRFYRYAVAISADGRNYTPLVNNSAGEWRSWQRIRVPSQPVKSVKLFGLYCSSNSQFHVVEFEAYSVVPR